MLVSVRGGMLVSVRGGDMLLSVRGGDMLLSVMGDNMLDNIHRIIMQTILNNFSTLGCWVNLNFTSLKDYLSFKQIYHIYIFYNMCKLKNHI